MKKILYYSDCPFFAGCENMLVNFFGSDELSSEFELTFLYRYSERYEEGAKKRMDMSRSIPINLVVAPPKSTIVTSKKHFAAKLQKAWWSICVFFVKYYSIYVNYKRITPILRSLKPDLIHINNGGYPAATSCYSVVLAATKCGNKNIVYVVNNMADDYRHPLRWFDRRLDKIVKKSVLYFINGSNNAGLRLKEVLKLPDSQQVTIRNGIIPRMVTRSREEFRKVYNIDNNVFVFAEVANLEVRKGHLVLLKAVKKLIVDNTHQKFVVLLEGDGPLKEEISAYIKENELSEIVRMIEVAQIYNLYNAIDVLVLPSIHTEDFPNTIIEAMGMGKPVIGTSIAGIPEQIDDHVNGLLIKASDAEALEKAMEEILEDKELYNFCSKNARDKFNKNYTAEISVKNYRDLYRSILNS